LGTTWGQQQLWVQTGCKKHRKYKIEEGREYVTWQRQIGPTQHSCATWQLPIGPPQLGGTHTPTDLTGGPHDYATWQATIQPCHTVPGTCGQILLGHIRGCINTNATWRCAIGGQQKEGCQMVTPKEATSSQACHMAVSYWSTSAMWTPPCYKMTDKWAPLGATWHVFTGAMSSHSIHRDYMWLQLIGTSQHKAAHVAQTIRATSLIINRSLVLRVCLLSNQPIIPCHFNLLTLITILINCQPDL
jgi:hypothetical protein